MTHTINIADTDHAAEGFYMPDHLSQNRPLPRLFWGVLLLGLGTTLLIDNFIEVVYISAQDVEHLWPLVLILIGVGKMTGTIGRREGGFGLFLLGSWLLLNTMSAWAYRETWPVLILFWGLELVLDSFRRRQPTPEQEESHVG